ncbi:MAG: RNA polymerase sigma factor (sigma-70 family) [Chlamydiales bacterium]|jgi:RNA polymerase sigma factor (sigma-70 family)
MIRFRDTGAEDAFATLYTESRAGLLVWIVGRMGTCGMKGDPTELLQDTFVSIYRYAASFRDEKGYTFRGWARTIAANAVRRARSRRSTHLSYQALPVGALEPTDQGVGPHDSLVRGEQCESLSRAWMLVLLHYAAAAQQLSARDREALHMVEVEGHSYADVARHMRVRLSNTKMIIFRARKRIRNHMLAAFASAGACGLQLPERRRQAVGE